MKKPGVDVEREMTVLQLIEEVADKARDADAITAPGRRPLTYERMFAFVMETIEQLGSAGIGRKAQEGDMVFAIALEAYSTDDSNGVIDAYLIPPRQMNGDIPYTRLADGTDGELITWDADGHPATVAAGTATHVLTSNGAGAAPTFQAASGGQTQRETSLGSVEVVPCEDPSGITGCSSVEPGSAALFQQSTFISASTSWRVNRWLTVFSRLTSSENQVSFSEQGEYTLASAGVNFSFGRLFFEASAWEQRSRIGGSLNRKNRNY